MTNTTIILKRVMMRVRQRAGAVTASAAMGALLLAGSGCAPKGQSGSMNTALSEYNAQHYDEAHDQAAAVMSKASGVPREKAAYVAGLSAYQAGNFEAAEQELTVAAGSSDAATAGDAKVMLGQLRLDQHRPREAATQFADASRLLEGEDARQAAWHAGLAYREARDEANAKRWLDTASSAKFDQPAQPAEGTSSSRGRAPSSTALASPSAPPSQAKNAVVMSADEQSPVGFTLQVGAFNEKGRAKKAAEEAEDFARKQSLGRVRIIPRKDARGQPVYLVQVGWWVSRDEATAARTKVGKLEYIVAPAAPLS
jgi:hypothetical protein